MGNTGSWTFDGKLLEAARVRANVSLLRAAESMGYKRPEPIRRYEVDLAGRASGKTCATPSADTVAKFADLYSCAPGDFFRRI